MSKETRVKVNAWVDESIAPLVKALSYFDVIILDSFGGNTDRSTPAYVAFRYRGTEFEALSFISSIAKAIREAIGLYDCVLSVRWKAIEDGPFLRIALQRARIQAVADCIESYASSLLALGGKMSRCQD